MGTKYPAIIAADRDRRQQGGNGRYSLIYKQKPIVVQTPAHVIIYDTIAEEIVFQQDGDFHNCWVSCGTNGNVKIEGTKSDGAGGGLGYVVDTGVKWQGIPFEGTPVEPPAPPADDPLLELVKAIDAKLGTWAPGDDLQARTAAFEWELGKPIEGAGDFATQLQALRAAVDQILAKMGA